MKNQAVDSEFQQQNEKQDSKRETRQDDVVIQVSQLRKQYGNHVAVKDISFQVNKGSIFALVGPNGAGKTTTVECMEGLRKPDQGTVHVLGLDPQKNRKQLFRSVGVQFQENCLHPRIKVKEALQVFSSFYPDPAPARELLRKCELEGKENDTYGKLSGGQKRRLLLALALLGKPKLLVLDEPTSGLDPQARFNIWRLLKELRDAGTTIFLTTHYMDEAEQYCDTLCLIDHGTVVAMGNPKELLAQHRIELCLKINTDTGIDEQELTAIPEVSRVENVDRELFIYGAGQPLLTKMSRLLESKQVPLNEMEIRRAGLEDLYLILTGREYRKE